MRYVPHHILVPPSHLDRMMDATLPRPDRDPKTMKSLLRVRPIRRASTRRVSHRRELACERMETRALMTIDFTSVLGIGGNSDLFADAVALDNAGNSYVTGGFAGTTSLSPSAATSNRNI